MTLQDAHASDDPAAFPQAPLSLVEAQLHLLGQLAEAGLRIAEALKREATGEAARTMPLSAIALAFSRVSRAVRLSVMLSAKLCADARTAQAEAAAHPQAALAGEARAFHDIDAPSDAEAVAATDDAVERADLGEGAEQDSAERGERRERLDRPDREDFRHLLVLPPAEVIDIIRRDLGLPPGWPAQSSPSPPGREGTLRKPAAFRREMVGASAPSVVLSSADGAGRRVPCATPPPPLRWGGERSPSPIQPRGRWRKAAPPDG